MALIKEYSLDSGVDVSYWDVSRIAIDNEQSIAVIHIAAYISKKAKEAGKKPVADASLDERVEDLIYKNADDPRSKPYFTKYFSKVALSEADLYAAAYRYLKEVVPFFQHAEDA